MKDCGCAPPPRSNAGPLLRPQFSTISPSVFLHRRGGVAPGMGALLDGSWNTAGARTLGAPELSRNRHFHDGKGECFVTRGRSGCSPVGFKTFTRT